MGSYDEVQMIHYVDVSVARELDAEVLDFQDGLHGCVRGEAVGALRFYLTKGCQALFQHLSLSGIGQLRVCHHAVGLAVARQLVVACGYGCLRWGCHGIGDALREDVQAEHRYHDGQAREERLPPAACQHAIAGIGQDVAPGGCWFWDACGDERQGCLEDDGVSHQHDGEYEHGSDAIADHVLDQDPVRPSAGYDDGAHVILVVFAHHVRAYDTSDLGYIEEPDGEDERGHGIAEHDDEGGGQGDAREGHDDVQDTHDEVRQP